MTPAIISRVSARRPVIKRQAQPYLIDRTADRPTVIEAEEGLHLYRCTIPNGSIDLGVEVIAENIHHAKAMCEAEARRLYGYRRLRWVKA